MKKTLALLVTSAFVLMGCDSQTANAQSQVSADVGDSDSANIMVIQEGYEVIEPASQPNGMEPLPGDPGVEVAPADIPSAPVTTPAPVQNTDNITVDETVTPNTSTYEVDETVN